MEVIEYNFKDDYINDYIKLIERLYPKNNYIKIFQKNIEFLLNKKNPYFKYAKINNFIIYQNKECIGHLTATIDQRLINNVGFISFFEATSDEVAKQLFDNAISWFKSQKIKEVRGPINLSIWHNYRLVTFSDNTPSFLFEPFNSVNYPKYLENFGFQVVENYISAFRNEFSSIIKYTKSKYEGIKKSEFSIRSIDLNKINDDFKKLYQLSLEIFKNSWSFTPISFEEFAYLYKDIDKKINKRYCHFISKKNQEIGFCFSIQDPLAKEKTLIMKTIGVLPEFQKNNLGSALIYLQTKNATEDDFKKIIYALMRQNNVASNINPYGAEIFRKYQVYNLFL